MMDRIVARGLRRDPSAVQRAKALLSDLKSGSRNPEWWVDEWLEVLARPAAEVARFVTSRDVHARRLNSASPFYLPEVSGIDFSDVEWRRKVWAKASRGLALAHARKTEDGHENGRTPHGR